MRFVTALSSPAGAPRRVSRVLGRVLAGALCASSWLACATPKPTAPTTNEPRLTTQVEMFETPTTTTTALEVDPLRLCRVVADVDDAALHNALGLLRVRYDGLPDDRAAAFGAMLSRPKNDERFRVFHDDERTRPLSVVGPLGSCIVYSDWKMAAQRQQVCGLAASRLVALGGDEALVRYADAILQWRQGDVDGALATVNDAVAKSPSCAALPLLRARLSIIKGVDVPTQKQVWADAEAAMPGCFTCALEQGKLIEQTDGKLAAAAAWERALKAVPDHADTLRRLAASVAGVDDARALAAFASAVDAGARDFATLLAAAKLAAQLAKTPADVDRALGYARRAVDGGRSDPDARRLVVTLALRSGDLLTATTAARALLDLAPDDLAAHAALARAAMKDGNFADASQHYEVVATEAAAGRTAGLDQPTLSALADERVALLTRLGVDDSARAAGGPATIAQNTQRTLTKLWRKRVEENALTGGGVMTVVVETNATGRVVDVVIKNDPLNDKLLEAAAIAALRRTTIWGGAKRYTLDFTLQ
jgi:tetratricopeptide (TPR) repeat protein